MGHRSTLAILVASLVPAVVFADDDDPATLKHEVAAEILAQRESVTGRPFGTGNGQRVIQYLAASLSLQQLEDIVSGRRVAAELLRPLNLGDSLADLTFTPVPPCRIIDTRVAGGPISGSTFRSFVVTGTTGFSAQGGTSGGCGVPVGSTAAVLNVVAVSPGGPGNLRAYAYDEPLPSPPNAATLNFGVVSGLPAIANGTIVPLCDPLTQTCTLDLIIYSGVSHADVVVDVTGYYQAFPTGDIMTTVLANDGAGSGLDADLVDGSDLVDLAVPSGAVLFFDLPSCPTGWTAMSSAEGRTIVGRASGGALGGTVGSALGDLEDRGHSHTVNPSAVSSSSNGSHSHSVDPPATTNAAVVSHTHTIDPPSTGTTSDAHNHQWSQYNNGAWAAYNSSGTAELLTNWTNGIGNEGDGWDPFAVTTTHGFKSYYTLSDTHSHSLDIGAFSSGANGSHAHLVNIPSFSSGSVVSHTHSVDVATTASSTASTSAVIPYIQFLVCRKD